ncbi:MAG: LysR family transcriptional regulator [Eubacterium sp.]
MDIRVLRYFLAVAREENISKAAEYLHITQPTLSRQLKELEDELNVSLFTRGKRSITLTDKGMLLRKRAEEITSLMDKTEVEFSNLDNLISGDVYIGGGETLAMKILAEVMTDMSEEYPDVRFHLYSGNADNVMDRIDKGLLEFGVVIEPADIRKYEAMRLPYTDHYGLIMKKDDPLASMDTIPISMLKDIPILVAKRIIDNNYFSEIFGISPEQLDIRATFNLIYNAALLVEQGMGYALTIDKLINVTGDNNLCFVPLEPETTLNLSIIWKRYQLFSGASKEFLDRLKERLKRQ